MSGPDITKLMVEGWNVEKKKIISIAIMSKMPCWEIYIKGLNKFEKIMLDSVTS